MNKIYILITVFIAIVIMTEGTITNYMWRKKFKRTEKESKRAG